MQASITAGVPDHVPVAQRGLVSGWIGLPQTVGVVLAVVLVTVVVTGNAGYVLTAVLVVACVLPFALTTPDPPLPRSARPPFAWRAFARSFWLSPRRYPDFAWAWLTRFAVNLGNAMALLYLLYFLRDKIHYSQLFPGQKAENGLLVLILIYTVAVVLTAVTGGVVSDRTGRRKLPVTVSGLVMAVPAVMLALWPSWPVAIASAAIMGLGFGVYLSVDQALVTQVLPSAADAGQGPGHHQHRQLRAAGAGPGDRRAAGQPARRVPHPVPVRGRHHRARVGVRLEDPLRPLTAAGPGGPGPDSRYVLLREQTRCILMSTMECRRAAMSSLRPRRHTRRALS